MLYNNQGTVPLPYRWIAYSHVDFSGSQYILEKGFYNNCADWGSQDTRICSVQPILLVRTAVKSSKYWFDPCIHVLMWLTFLLCWLLGSKWKLRFQERGILIFSVLCCLMHLSLLCDIEFYLQFYVTLRQDCCYINRKPNYWRGFKLHRKKYSKQMHTHL